MNANFQSPQEAHTKVAYSYIRFSTPEQGKGSSFQRQVEASSAYVKRRGLKLDSSLNLFDKGLSAFNGENREEGALAEFLAAIHSGKVKRGSVLILENLDRLSRQTASKAITLFLGILQAGVEIVTLGDHEQVYTESSINTNFGQLIGSLTTFARGHEESLIKSQRLSATWKLKRENPATKLTAKAPAWLKLSSDRHQFEVIKERAELIKRIFEMAANGIGRHRIAKKLNAEGIPVWGRGKIWHTSYIKKLLSGRSVLGEFQPHLKPSGGKRTPTGDVFENYFPQIISYELFQKVNSGRKSRMNSGGRVGDKISNLFTHLAKCGYCGASMQYVQKGRGNVYLVCSTAKGGGGCRYMSWPYVHFEGQFLKFVEELDYSHLTSDSSADKLRKKRETVERLESELAELSLKQQRLLDLIECGAVDDTGAVAERLKALQTQEQRAQETYKQMQVEYRETCTVEQELKQHFNQVVELVKAKSDPEIRQKLAAEIRRKIRKIEICPSGGLTRDAARELPRLTDTDFDRWLRTRERSETEWFFVVTFINGESRTIMPRENGYILTGSLPPSFKATHRSTEP